ncbi:hypothetical protein Slin15195_G047490 [Septoria linicola]|uniref:Fungal N-terminal domain-containing protein n=1 Tax=Septoria linicola TaxID=215465 RepID=A0A9Q9ARX2_9PEZI|nr:hypothetical protein Slin14017_G051020 [Septoria linicola]USW51430.1 hypothetical protein Slin15195_G047490 [Septoria linicola]
MAFQPLSVGDILMLSQTAWKIGRAFNNGKNNAPAEFAEVERESNSLSESLKLVAETLHEDNSILSLADIKTKEAVNTILESAHKTLEDLESFVDRYQVIKKMDTGHGGFVVERSWSSVVLANYRTFKWTTEGGDIQALRNMLQMHVDCINLTMQALQSRSLARLEKTVVPMAENVASIHDSLTGDLGPKINDVHEVIMAIVSSTPSLEARSRKIESGHIRDSASTSSSSVSDRPLSCAEGRLLEAPQPTAKHDRTSLGQNRKMGKAPVRSSATARLASNEEFLDFGEEHQARTVEWDCVAGSPEKERGNISDSKALCASPRDSAYAGEESSRRASWRRESATLPALFKTVGDDHSASVGSSPDLEDEIEDFAPPLPLKSTRRRPPPPPPVRTPPEPRMHSQLLPPPAMDAYEGPHPVATPSTILSALQRTRSDVDERTQLARFAVKIPHRQTIQLEAHGKNDGQKFEKQLLRNAAILCDVRGRLVEFAHINAEITDERYKIEMKEACKECRICVIRKRENREHGGTRVVTSVWSLADDHESRLQQKLSEFQETVPYCSCFEPEKVSLQATDEAEISLKFHTEEWGAMLKDEKKTNWVNYYFATEADAVSFQSAVFGRTLLGSFRTTKTTVIHEGLKGAFAFEEQFANIEMLRLWEEDGVETPGAAGGVMALMHISSNFGEGWARWWINNSRQHVRIKEDGSKHARVKGIDVTVVRPGATARQAQRARSASLGIAAPHSKAAEKDAVLKRVNGVKIEFKEQQERIRFVKAAKEAQGRSMPLPECKFALEGRPQGNI